MGKRISSWWYKKKRKVQQVVEITFSTLKAWLNGRACLLLTSLYLSAHSATLFIPQIFIEQAGAEALAGWVILSRSSAV